MTGVRVDLSLRVLILTLTLKSLRSMRVSGVLGLLVIMRLVVTSSIMSASFRMHLPIIKNMEFIASKQAT